MSIRNVAIALCAAVGSSAFAQVNYAFEGLAPGSIIGQDGWAYTEAGTANANVDNTIFSPMGGSTQSLRMEGGTSSTRIARFLGSTINSGIHTVGYDMRHSPRVGGNLVMSTIYYQEGGTSQIFQPYAQNGGGAGAAQNAFTDLDGLGGAGYAGTGWLPGTLTPDTWYRLEFDIDFDTKQISNGRMFDISSGSKVLVDSSPTVFFLNNDGANYFDDFDRLGVRLGGQVDAAEGWNIDNFSTTPVPEPGTMVVLSLGALGLLRRRAKK